MSASPSDYVRQLLERLRPDRRTSLAIGLAAAACFGLAYRDALADMERRDPTLPPHAVSRAAAQSPTRLPSSSSTATDFLI